MVTPVLTGLLTLLLASPSMCFLLIGAEGAVTLRSANPAVVAGDDLAASPADRFSARIAAFGAGEAGAVAARTGEAFSERGGARIKTSAAGRRRVSSCGLRVMAVGGGGGVAVEFPKGGFFSGMLSPCALQPSALHAPLCMWPPKRSETTFKA